MTSHIERARDYLAGTKGAWRPTIERFPSIDREQLINDLRIPKFAKRIRDESDLATKISSFSDATSEIELDLSERFAESTNEFKKQLNIYDQRILESSIGPEARVSVKAASEECKSDFEAQVTEDFLPLNYALRDVEELSDEYTHFRMDHGLTLRSPVVQDHTEITSGFLWVAVIVLFETVTNGFFFSQGSPAGIVGGFLEALSLSVLNVSLAVILGLFTLRYIQHKSWFWKVTSGISLPTIISLTLVLNLIISHYREAFTVAEGSSVRFDLVIQSVMTEPFSVHQSESWLLGVLGLLCNIYAAHKVYKLYDPYPGYTNLVFRRDQAREQLSDRVNKCLDNLKSHRDNSIVQIEGLIEDINKNRNEFAQASSRRIELIEEYGLYVKSIESLISIVEARLIALSEIDLQTDVAVLSKVKVPRPSDIPSPSDATTDIHESLVSLMESTVSEISEKYTLGVNQILEKQKRLADK